MTRLRTYACMAALSAIALRAADDAAAAGAAAAPDPAAAPADPNPATPADPAAPAPAEVVTGVTVTAETAPAAAIVDPAADRAKAAPAPAAKKIGPRTPPTAKPDPDGPVMRYLVLTTSKIADDLGRAIARGRMVLAELAHTDRLICAGHARPASPAEVARAKDIVVLQDPQA